MDMIPLYVSGFLYILGFSMRFHLIEGLQQKMWEVTVGGLPREEEKMQTVFKALGR